MKRLIALALAVGLICAASPAWALYVPKHIDEFDNLPDMPRLSEFAAMRTWQEDEIVTIYLDKPVDNLRANWLEYMNEHEEELEVEDEGDVFIAYLDTTGHKYQVGAHWTNAYATETYTEKFKVKTAEEISKMTTEEKKQYEAKKAQYDEDKASYEYNHRTELRSSDEDEGKKVGDEMAQRDTMYEVTNKSTGATSTTKVQVNDSYYNELKGYLFNDQPETVKFNKHEITFDSSSSVSTVTTQINTLIKTAEQEALAATDSLGQKHYDKTGNRADLNNYYCVKVEEPYYAVVKQLDDGKFCILSRYKYTANLSSITVPSGFKLYRVNGYVTAWHPTYAASDGTSDGRYTVAYLSDQTIDGETWTVAYGRNGKIQWFYLRMYDTEFFEQDLGTTIIKFEPCNTGWFIREITEEYEDGTYVSAYFNRTGNGKLSYYRASEFFQSDDDDYDDYYE